MKIICISNDLSSVLSIEEVNIRNRIGQNLIMPVTPGRVYEVYETYECESETKKFYGIIKDDKGVYHSLSKGLFVTLDELREHKINKVFS
jgi:hypothetical protein